MSEQNGKLPHPDVREAVLQAYQSLSGVTLPGTGNVGQIILDATSRKVTEIVVTPSGLDAQSLTPDDMTIIYREDSRRHLGLRKPTSEAALYRHIARHTVELLGRDQNLCVVHAHPFYATTVALLQDITQRTIPPSHYTQPLMVSGDGIIRCSQRVESGAEIFASAETAKGVVETMGIQNAVLWSDHGVVTVGRTFGEAMKRLRFVEEFARRHLETLSDRRQRILTVHDCTAIERAATSNYGQQRSL